MECPKCQSDNRKGVKFCEECGTKLELKCPSCTKKIPLGTKFCGECGHQLKEKKINKKQSPAIDSERKNVTVLFSDMSGYTAMTERLDPEEVKDLMSRIFGEIAQVITKYEGFIERFIGDAVMAIFGVPTGQYNEAQEHYHAAASLFDMYGQWPSATIVSKLGLARTKFLNNKGDKDIDIENLYRFVSVAKAKLYKGWIRRLFSEIFLHLNDERKPEAEIWIKKAIKTDDRNGVLFELGRDYACYAEILKQKGEESSTLESLNKALDIFKNCGAQGWVGKYEKRLADIVN